MHQLEIGVMCFENFQNELGIGWSGFNLKVFVVRILFLPVLDRLWRFISRYSKVVDAEEREIPLGGDPEASEPHRRGFLAYVWEVVGRTALEQVLGTAEAKARNSTAGALEEDARLTALFLWTLQSTNGNGAKVARGRI